MKLSFSYAVVLHRVLDSAPPEKTAVFYAHGRLLRPYKKPGGLYVFADEPEQPLEIACQGYQAEQALVRLGEVRHVCLYPDGSYLPPAGWEVTQERAPPGSILFWADKRYAVRLLSLDNGSGAARLQAKPGFIGGCLRFAKGDFAQVALILEKEPPNLYHLSAFDTEASGGAVAKGYAARADALGNCAMVLPQGLYAAIGEKGGDELSGLE